MDDPERPKGEPDRPAPFDAFRELAENLMRVPKAEADAEEAKYQQEREAKPKRGPKKAG